MARKEGVCLQKTSPRHPAVSPRTDRALPGGETLWGGLFELAEKPSKLRSCASTCPTTIEGEPGTDFLKNHQAREIRCSIPPSGSRAHAHLRLSDLLSLIYAEEGYAPGEISALIPCGTTSTGSRSLPPCRPARRAGACDSRRGNRPRARLQASSVGTAQVIRACRTLQFEGDELE